MIAASHLGSVCDCTAILAPLTRLAVLSAWGQLANGAKDRREGAETGKKEYEIKR